MNKKIFMIVFFAFVILISMINVNSFDWTDDLRAHYNFDTNSGTLLIDSLGLINGTFADGSVNWTSGKINYALADNTTASINFSNNFKFNEFTWNLWLNPAGGGATGVGIMGFFNDSGIANSTYLYQRSNKIFFSLNNETDKNPSSYTITSISNFTGAEGWNMVSVVMNSSGSYLYVNGTLENSTNLIFDVSSNIDNFYLFWDGAQARYGGKIDELSIFNRSLKASELLELYNSDNGLTYSLDTTPPNISMVYPTNTTYSILSGELNYTVSSDAQACWYNLFGGGSSECYQESANISTSCGGLNSGNYISDFVTNKYKLYDGDWATSGMSNSEGRYLISNYTKPSYTKNLTWQISHCTTPIVFNITIPNSCSNDVLSLKILDNRTPTNRLEFECYNGSDYIYLSNSTCSGYNAVYEESITWNIENFTITCGQNVTGLTANSGSNNWTIYANDSSGNINSSSITFDYSPSINAPTIIYPANITYNYLVSALNYTHVGASYCWASNNSGITNTTIITAGQNFTGLNSSEGSNNFTLWCNDSVNNLNLSSVTFSIDTTFPLISITTPTNNTNSTNINLDINYTWTETNKDTCWYSNDTYLKNTTLAGCSNLTSIVWAQGNHNVTIWINDTAGNTNQSSITFGIDSIPPNISIYTPLNQTYNTSTILFNVSINEQGNCSYTLNGGINNYTMASIGGLNFSDTNSTMAQGEHNVTFYCNDTIGNKNQSSKSFYIDSINPDINMTYPENRTYNYMVSAINYTHTGASYCWASNNSGKTNTTKVTAGQNFTGLNSSVGDNNFTIWCNDSVNNFNTTSITFRIDLVNPNIIISSPTAITYSESSVLIDIRTNESGECFYSFDNGTINTSMTANSSNTGFTAVRSFAELTFTLHAYCNDSGNNRNDTESVIFVVSVGSGGDPGGGGDETPAPGDTIDINVGGVSTPGTIIAVNDDGSYDIDLNGDGIIDIYGFFPQKPVGGGGGGESERGSNTYYIVLALKQTAKLNESNLTRAQIYALINKRCEEQFPCYFYDSTLKEIVLEAKQKMDFDLSEEDLKLWITQYNSKNIEELEIIDYFAKQYGLIRKSIIIPTTPLSLNPFSLVRYWFWSEEKSVFKWEINSNKDIKECSIVNGSVFYTRSNCSIISNSTAVFTYNLQELSKVSDVIKGQIKIKSEEGEVKYIPVSINVYNYKYPVFGIPLYIVLLLSLIIAIAGGYYLIRFFVKWRRKK